MDLKQHYQRVAHEACPIYTFLGLQVESIEDGIYRSRIPLNDNTKNHVNIVHAGPMWMTAEYLGGLIAADNLSNPKYQPVIAGLNIKFLRPAMTDITAETEFTADDAAAMKKGTLFIISAPSGAGKTSLVSEILERELPILKRLYLILQENVALEKWTESTTILLTSLPLPAWSRKMRF